MEIPKIFESEYRFCLILWENEPINSTKLVVLCKEQLGWSKATTYTVIRRLAERKVLKNEDATVTSLVSKEQIQQAEMAEMMDKTFQNSLPDFIAAFCSCKKLTAEQARQLELLIAHCNSEGDN